MGSIPKAVSQKNRCLPCEDGRILLVGAFVLRLAWAWWCGRLIGYHDDGAYDDGMFLDMARAFVSGGHLYETRAPGYPLFLAPFLTLGGHTLAKFAQLLVAAALAPLTYRLALALRRERGEALIAGGLVALSPMLIYFSARFMSESWFVALSTSFLLAWLYAWQSGSARAAALAGVLGGAATLARGVILPFGGVLALVALLRRKEQPRWIALVALCGLAWAGVVAPWTARNWRAYGRFVPVSVQGGWNFYEGLTVDPDEIRYKRADAMGAEARALGIAGDPFAMDAHFGAKAKAWIRENPGAFLRLCLTKFVRFWRLAPEPPHGRVVRWGAGLFSIILLGGALLGLRAGVLSAPGAWFPAAFIVHLALLHSVFASNLRYRLPLEPIFAVLAGVGLFALARAARSKR